MRGGRREVLARTGRGEHGGRRRGRGVGRSRPGRAPWRRRRPRRAGRTLRSRVARGHPRGARRAGRNRGPHGGRVLGDGPRTPFAGRHRALTTSALRDPGGGAKRGGVDGARGRRGSTAFAGARGVARRLGERGADAPDERAGWSGRRRGRARPARGPGRLDLLGGGGGRARDRAGGVQRPPRRPSRDRAAVRNERGGAPPGLPLDHPPPRRRAAGGSAARAPLVEARAGPGVAPAAGMRARSAGPLGAAGARRGRSPSRIGAHPQAARSSVAAWTARRPAPSAIWWRQEVPSATIQSEGSAARTAGRSDSSPIARETSAVSRW